MGGGQTRNSSRSQRTQIHFTGQTTISDGSNTRCHVRRNELNLAYRNPLRSSRVNQPSDSDRRKQIMKGQAAILAHEFLRQFTARVLDYRTLGKRPLPILLLRIAALNRNSRIAAPSSLRLYLHLPNAALGRCFFARTQGRIAFVHVAQSHGFSRPYGLFFIYTSPLFHLDSIHFSILITRFRLSSHLVFFISLSELFSIPFLPLAYAHETTMRRSKREGRTGTKFSALLQSDPLISSSPPSCCSDLSAAAIASPNPMISASSSPYIMSPYSKSPWSSSSPVVIPFADEVFNGPIGSLVREEGHVYSLAAAGDLLYTGSESKNIRVWRKQQEFGGFKSSSGLVKAIVVADGGKIFTGHQDGKIRVWKSSGRVHKRTGTLPTLKDLLKSSINPNNYVEVRRRRTSIWIRHFDAVSCLSLDQEHGVLYSGSWDKTLKVWRIRDSKCLESVNAHDDAINSVAVGFGGLVFTGSADGTVKAWKQKFEGKRLKHSAAKTLLTQDSAVTALAVNAADRILYAGSSDGLVSYWEKQKMLSHGGVLRGHKLAVLCLAAAGSLVFSGSADKTICVWRREGAAHTWLTLLSGHLGPVKCLAVEEEEEEDRRWTVYSGSLDRSVKVWKVAEQQGSAMSFHTAGPVGQRTRY
ncbi:hypothetical protein ACLOJK_002951 [Asimina triloba]